jgi:tRNA A37 threonylcarbamoyladenosine synthetase subunit TsaC/SUA5/YrdC
MRGSVAALRVPRAIAKLRFCTVAEKPNTSPSADPTGKPYSAAAFFVTDVISLLLPTVLPHDQSRDGPCLALSVINF